MAATAATLGLPIVIILAVMAVNGDPNVVRTIFQVADPVSLAFSVGGYYFLMLIVVPTAWMMISDFEVPKRRTSWSWLALVALGVAGMMVTLYIANPAIPVILGLTVGAGIAARWVGNNVVFGNPRKTRRVSVALGIATALLLSVAFVPPFPLVQATYSDGTVIEGRLVDQDREGIWLLVPIDGTASFDLVWQGGEVDSIQVCTGHRDPCQSTDVTTPPSAGSPSSTPSPSVG